MILPWFDVVLRPDERFIRLAAAEGPDFVGGYVVFQTADETYQLVHVWTADERQDQPFVRLNEAELRHVVRVLEQHMRGAPAHVQTTDRDTALALARRAASTGRFMPELAESTRASRKSIGDP